MSGRIPPYRPGYSGYTCTFNYIPIYILGCMCCADDVDCEPGYLNIPTRAAISTKHAAWGQLDATYITRGEPVPGTDRHIWITTDGATPPECSDDMNPAYDFLETEYIDVPPIRTRGLSVRYSTTGSSSGKATCEQCYSVDKDADGFVIKIYWTDYTNTKIDAETDDDGNILPITVSLDQLPDGADGACDSIGIGENIGYITYSYCVGAGKTNCVDCYYVEKLNGVNDNVYWVDKNDQKHVALEDAGAQIMPITMKASDVKREVVESCAQPSLDVSEIEYMTFIYCPSFPVVCPKCYKKGEDQTTGESYRYYLDDANQQVPMAIDPDGVFQPSLVSPNKVAQDTLDECQLMYGDGEQGGPWGISNNSIFSEGRVTVTQIMFYDCYEGTGGGCSLCYETEYEHGVLSDVYWWKQGESDTDPATKQSAVPDALGNIHPITVSSDLVPDAFLDACMGPGVTKDDISLVTFTYCPPFPVVCPKCYKKGVDDGSVGEAYRYYLDESETEVKIFADAEGVFQPSLVSPDKISSSVLSDCQNDYEGAKGVDGGGDFGAGDVVVTQIMFYDCYEGTGGGVGCSLCYETEYVNGVVSDVYWWKQGESDTDPATKQSAVPDASGNIPPITVSADLVPDTFLDACVGLGVTKDDISLVTFTYCPPFPVVCPKCYKKGVDQTTGDSYRYYLDDANQQVPMAIDPDGVFQPSLVSPNKVAQDTLDECQLMYCDGEQEGSWGISGNGIFSEGRVTVTQIMFYDCYEGTGGGCSLCYETEYEHGVLSDVYWWRLGADGTGPATKQSAVPDASGNIPPITVSADLVPDAFLDACMGPGVTKDDISLVTFTYCPPFPVVCPKCYKKGVDDGSVGEAYRYYLDNGGERVKTYRDDDNIYQPVVVSPDEVSNDTLTDCESKYEGTKGIGSGGDFGAGDVVVTQIMFYDCISGAATCSMCYKTEYENGVLTRVYWEDMRGIQTDALYDDDGNIKPITISALDVDSNVLDACVAKPRLDYEDVEYVTFEYCPVFPVVCPKCFLVEPHHADGDPLFYYLDEALQKVPALSDAATGVPIPTLVVPDKVDPSVLAACQGTYENDFGNKEGMTKVTQILYEFCPSDLNVCHQCYEVERDSDNIITSIYYLDDQESHVDAQPDADGGFLSSAVRIDAVSSSYDCPIGTTQVVFSYCPKDFVEYDESQNLLGGASCSGKFIKILPDSTNMSYQIAWDFRHIAGYSPSDKYGLIIENGCPKWLKMDECPE